MSETRASASRAVAPRSRRLGARDCPRFSGRRYADDEREAAEAGAMIEGDVPAAPRLLPAASVSP